MHSRFWGVFSHPKAMRLGLAATATPEDLKREQPGMGDTEPWHWHRHHGAKCCVFFAQKEKIYMKYGIFQWFSYTLGFKSCGDLWNFQCLQPILHMIRRVPKVGFARSLERLLVTVCHGKSVWPGFSREKVELQQLNLSISYVRISQDIAENAEQIQHPKKSLKLGL